MKKILLLFVLSITINFAYSISNKKMGISNLKFTDSRESVLNKLEVQFTDNITCEQCADGRDYIIKGVNYSFTFKTSSFNYKRITGDIIIMYSKNRISKIIFIPSLINSDKYLDYLNNKYFPNIDSDNRWWNKNLTIIRSKNNIFSFIYTK